MERDCKHCKHYVLAKRGEYWEDIYACVKWECEYEPEQEEEDDN